MSPKAGQVIVSTAIIDLAGSIFDVLDSIASSQGVFLPAKPSLPLGETFGGKIALIAVLGLGLTGAIRYFSPNQS